MTNVERRHAAVPPDPSLRFGLFPTMTAIHPPGEVGMARISHVTVSEEAAAFHNMRLAFRPGTRLDQIRPGTYAQLFVDRTLIMSDTDMELWTNLDAVHGATGDVLIGGLGLGLILLPILEKIDVRSVTVIEACADVIALVLPKVRLSDRGSWITSSTGATFGSLFLGHP